MSGHFERLHSQGEHLASFHMAFESLQQDLREHSASLCDRFDCAQRKVEESSHLFSAALARVEQHLQQRQIDDSLVCIQERLGSLCSELACVQQQTEPTQIGQRLGFLHDSINSIHQNL